MEKKVYCPPDLSLADLTLRKVVVKLWNEADILSAISKFRFSSMNYAGSIAAFREDVEDKVADKLSKLPLPGRLKKEMLSLVKPIGSEIRGWKRFHEKYLSDSTEQLGEPILEKLHWTPLATIDFRKTAEELIRCEMVNSVNRYKLASLYCLEDYISSLWEELPEEVKGTYYKEDDTSHFQQPCMPYIWPYILKGEESILNSMRGRIVNPDSIPFYQYAFENIARRGNKAAAEYFFSKLTSNQRNDSLVRTAHTVVLTRNIELYEDPNNSPMEKHSEVLCYLLSLMTPGQQMEVLKKRPSLFLRCFLDWPLHDHFLEMVGLIWALLPGDDYHMLIWNMSHAFIRSDYFVPKLFQEFFIHSPVKFKKYFLHQARHLKDFFSIFVSNEDPETIQVIFRNVDVADRKKLVNSRKFFFIVKDIIKEERWDIVELCLREATLSKRDRARLKKTYKKFSTLDSKLSSEGIDWHRFFQLLDEIGASTPQKRSLEDETLTKAKKLCL